MATTPVKTANDWLSFLVAASKGAPDIVPPGYKTLAQISKETGKSETQIRRYIREGLKQGRVLHAKFKLDTGTKIYPVAHYKLK